MATEILTAPTTTAPTSQPVTGTLSERAMLASLHISQWSARKQDKQAKAEVIAAHGTDEDVVNVTKRILAKDALAEIQAAADDAYDEHVRRTLPWGEEKGRRILSSVGYFDYVAMLNAHKAKFEAAVERFIPQYAAYRAAGMIAQGTLADVNEYPTEAEVRRRFAMTIEVDPLPAAPDFRVDIGDEATALIRADITARVEARERQAVAERTERVRNAVEHMAERLRSYTKGQREGNFTASLVENIRDLARTLPALNITNDPRIDELARQLETDLCQADAAELKDSPVMRAQTAARADAILASLSDFIA